MRIEKVIQPLEAKRIRKIAYAIPWQGALEVVVGDFGVYMVVSKGSGCSKDRTLICCIHMAITSRSLACLKMFPPFPK